MSRPQHLPVLPGEVQEWLAFPKGGCVVDATVGLGGHAALMLQQIGQQGLLIGMDVDPQNLEMTRRRLAPASNFKLFQANFRSIEAVLDHAGEQAVDGVLADLGVSSNQLEDPSRGLAFSHEGPLDMRLDPTLKTTASDLVNRLPERELADLLFNNAQERHSRRIAREIHRARHQSRITTTRQLADIVVRALKQDPDRQRTRIHPATRAFLALRIAVNAELEALEDFVQALPRVLKPGARAGVISFHSLEDGICKRAFRSMKQAGEVRLVNKKPVTPGAEERRANPRARSAKLRVIERTQ